MSIEQPLLDSTSQKDLIESFGVPIGDTERVFSVAFHPSKQYMAFGCENSCVKLWNIRTKMYVSIVPHLGQVHSVSFSHDGSLLCTASSGHTEGNTICLWECVYDVKNEEDILLKLLLCDNMLALGRLEVLHQDTISSVAFLPNRNAKDMPFVVASGSHDTTVRLWSYHSNMRMTRLVLRQHSAKVTCVAFSDDGRYLVSADESGAIVITRLHAPRNADDIYLEQQQEAKSKSKKQKKLDKLGSDIKKSEDMDEMCEEDMPLAPAPALTHQFTHHMHEPVHSLRFSPTHALVTQLGASRNSLPDNQYTLCVGTATALVVYSLTDGCVDASPQDVQRLHTELDGQVAARNRYIDDGTLTFLPRDVNFAQLTLLWRNHMFEPVRCLALSPLSSRGLQEDADAMSRELVSGLLKVKTDRYLLGKRVWDKWYCEVDVLQGKLAWYKTRFSNNPVGFIRLEAIKRVKALNQERSPGRFFLRLRGTSNKMEFLAGGRRDADRWVSGLQAAIELVAPETLVICAGVGSKVHAVALQMEHSTAKNPDADTRRALQLLPQVATASMAVVGVCSDLVTGVELPSTLMRARFTLSQVLQRNQFLLGASSADQSVRVFRWQLDAAEEEEEAPAEPPVLTWEQVQLLQDGDAQAQQELFWNLGRRPATLRPQTEDPVFPWVSLERPLTQHQLTMRVEEELQMRESKVADEAAEPETEILGQPRVFSADRLRLYKEDEGSEDSDAPMTAEELEVDPEEDEYEVMTDYSRRLLGPLTGDDTAAAVSMAQANPRPQSEARAAKIMLDAALDSDVEEDDDEEAKSPGRVPRAGDSAVLYAADPDEGKLSTFARLAEDQERQEMNNRDTCSADCAIM